MGCGALYRTFRDRMTLERASRYGGGFDWEVIAEDIPCALSRTAHTAAPEPAVHGAAEPESEYRMSLFLPPDVDVRLGDRATVGRRRAQFRGTLSHPVYYESHTAVVMNIREETHNDPIEADEAGTG